VQLIISARGVDYESSDGRQRRGVHQRSASIFMGQTEGSAPSPLSSNATKSETDGRHDQWDGAHLGGHDGRVNIRWGGADPQNL